MSSFWNNGNVSFRLFLSCCCCFFSLNFDQVVSDSYFCIDHNDYLFFGFYGSKLNHDSISMNGSIILDWFSFWLSNQWWLWWWPLSHTHTHGEKYQFVMMIGFFFGLLWFFYIPKCYYYVTWFLHDYDDNDYYVYSKFVCGCSFFFSFPWFYSKQFIHIFSLIDSRIKFETKKFFTFFPIWIWYV